MHLKRNVAQEFGTRSSNNDLLANKYFRANYKEGPKQAKLKAMMGNESRIGTANTMLESVV